MNNTTLTGEKVEVMALFNYSKIPCQPLYFRKRGGDAVPGDAGEPKGLDASLSLLCREIRRP